MVVVMQDLVFRFVRHCCLLVGSSRRFRGSHAISLTLTKPRTKYSRQTRKQFLTLCTSIYVFYLIKGKSLLIGDRLRANASNLLCCGIAARRSLLSVGSQTRNTLMAIAMIALSWQPSAHAQGTVKPIITAQTQNLDALLDQSYNAMYNLRFDEALRLAESAKRMANDDPVPWMAQACAVLFREFDHMHILRSELFAADDKFIDGPAFTWDPQRRKDFDTALVGAEKLAQERLKQSKDDPRALFALTLVTGLRADDAALIAKKKFSALSYTKSANGYAERLLARSPDYYDAYIATGMGKYIIGGKAAPVRWMLRLGGLKGDQEQGVKELALVADHGRFLMPFARILLAFDDLRHNNTAAARKKLEWLREHFPNNPLFLQEIAKLDHPTVGPGQN